MSQESAPPSGVVWSCLPGFCVFLRGPDSHRSGRTSPRPARVSETGAARESWRPSHRASTGWTGPASCVPSRTGRISCPLPESSGYPARTRGVSLPSARAALGRRAAQKWGPRSRALEGWGHRGGAGQAPARTGRGSWGAVGHLEREELRRTEGHGQGPLLRDRVEARSGRRATGAGAGAEGRVGSAT